MISHIYSSKFFSFTAFPLCLLSLFIVIIELKFPIRHKSSQIYEISFQFIETIFVSNERCDSPKLQNNKV